MESYQQHLREIDIPAWENGSGDWFNIHLFSLMAKADSQNFWRLSQAFPEEAKAFQWWQRGKADEPDPNAFDPRDGNSPGVW